MVIKKTTGRLTIYLDDEIRSKFRLLCAVLDKSMNEQINDLVLDFVKRNEGAININEAKLTDK